MNIDRFSFLITPEYSLFLVGAILILLAIISAFLGVIPVPGGRAAYRSKDPKTFWSCVVISLLAGVLCWVRFLYQPN